MAKTTKNNDALVEQLQKAVELKKAQIKDGERPSFKTNMMYVSFNGERINLQAAEESTLIAVTGEIMIRENSYGNGLIMLDLPEENYKFKVQGFTVLEWINDIKARITKINITKEKKKLAELELRLKSLMSEDKRTELALKEIQEMLK